MKIMTVVGEEAPANFVPAAAVIPAPIAYTRVAAVKKLVVGSRARARGVLVEATIACPSLPAGL